VSDTTADTTPQGDRRRTVGSLAAALGAHILVLVALTIGFSFGGAPAIPPVTIDLQVANDSATDGAGSLGGGGAAGASGPVDGTVPLSTGPTASPTPSAAAPAAGQGSDTSGFVIPAPRAAPNAAVSAGGPSFRETGGKTGVVQGIPSTPTTVSAPTVPAVQQGKGTGTAASTGAGASAEQRSGTGVLVTGSAPGASNGPLDLSKLDKALAAGAGKSAGTGGSESPGSAAGTGGSRTSGSGAGGPGSGGSTGTGGGHSYSVVWGSSGSGNGRTLVSTSAPNIPPWVSAQGLTLKVSVSFTVLADGVIGGTVIQQSSGYADVDASVIDAIRRWRFTPADGAAPAKGIIPYVIRAR
jgi:TonB family protein